MGFRGADMAYIMAYFFLMTLMKAILLDPMAKKIMHARATKEQLARSLCILKKIIRCEKNRLGIYNVV